MSGEVVSEGGAESEPERTPSASWGGAPVIPTRPTSTLSPHGPVMRQLGWLRSETGASSTVSVSVEPAAP